MEIERINENTVKFYISYVDIEDRGFEREEIWYNRERGEQLFWQMMEELNYKEDFNVDGPLWIQVQAMDKGLEIVVTKAQISQDGENIEMPTENGKTIDISVDDKLDDMLDDKFGSDKQVSTSRAEAGDDGNLSLIVRFNDFEDVIQLSHYLTDNDDALDNTLFHYKDGYFLYLAFPQEEDDEESEEDEDNEADADQEDTERQEDILSQVFEFGTDTDVTIYYLEEYGKRIFENNTFKQIRYHFPAAIGRSN